jgi:hypothetical protein
MQLAFPLSIAAHKLTLVIATISPIVSSEPMRLAELVRASIMVSILEVFFASSVFQAV